jgi:sterol desaturase/sphingolipid hydroxylase (fatty acid hydroxylase superfamily)
MSEAVRLRWLSNFGISILSAAIVRALFPFVGVAWAVYCAERGWGLFNHVIWPASLTVVLGIAWLDFLSYGQHVAMHKVPLFWRMHRVHHTDHDFDFSTGLRAHPAEMLLANVVMFAGILVAGASPLAVFLNQLLSISLSFLGHGNVRLPTALDRALRFVLVTPDMHRVHHSVDVREGESNFSNLFPWWDHLFATYLDQPAAGHTDMTFGVRGFEARKHLSLPWMLAQPFLDPNPPPSLDAVVATTVATDDMHPHRSR